MGIINPNQIFSFCGCEDNYVRYKTLREVERLNNNMESSDDNQIEGVEFIESYDANNNFFYYVKNITKIQKVFRGFSQRKKFKAFKKYNTITPSSMFNDGIIKVNKAEDIKFLNKSNTANKFEFDIFKNEHYNLDNKSRYGNEIASQNVEHLQEWKKTNEKKQEEDGKAFSINQQGGDNQEIINQDESTLGGLLFQTQCSFLTKIRTTTMNGKIIDNEPRGCFIRKNIKYTYKGNVNPITKKKCGFGKITWSDQSILLANFSGNQINGIAFYEDIPNGGEFSGIYKANQPCGYGLYKSEGIILEGEWKKNDITGIAFEYSDNDTYYQGDYKNCQKEGIGVFRWSDGTIYKGEFMDNMMHGFGIVNYNDERVFIGQMEDGQMNGYGEFYWGKEKKKYFGFYKNDLKEGFGVYVDSFSPLNGYIGFWEKGKMSGIGIKIKKEEFRYGIWKNGKIELWLQGPWEMSKHAKHWQIPAIKLMERRQHKIIEFIQSYLDF